MDPKSILNQTKQHTPVILGSKEFKKFAILLPLIEKDNETHVLFEVRSNHLRRQPGDICFPGGKIEGDDPNAKEAAIRETTEELGIQAADLEDVHPLDYIVSPFGMIVYPYAGYISQPAANIKPNPEEVQEVFTVPLSFFMKTEPRVHYVNFQAQPEENFPYELIAGGRDYNWRTRQIEEYFYLYEDKVIWGLTASVLAHFVEMIKC